MKEWLVLVGLLGPLSKVVLDLVPMALGSLHKHEDRISKLRLLIENKSLSGFMIPSSGECSSEYVSKCHEHLLFISGFTGSSGLAFVLKRKAAIFVDGRYITQARMEVDPRLFEIFLMERYSPLDWLSKVLVPGDSLGFDAWLLPQKVLESYKEMAKKMMVTLKPTENLVGTLLDFLGSQPQKSVNPLRIYPLSFAGVSSLAKINRVANLLRNHQCDVSLVTAADAVNWLLNVRGDDLMYTPVAFSFAIVYRARTVDYFVDLLKLPEDVEDQLIRSSVAIFPYDSFLERVKSLAREHKAFLLDPLTVPSSVYQAVEESGGIIVAYSDLVSTLKARKNRVEIRHMMEAHIRDGTALADLMAWLAKSVTQGGVDELTIVSQLETFRKRQKLYRGPSFATIAGSGPNGSIIHYCVNGETNRKLEKDDLLLIDSGGQYEDGCTDVSRTISFGKPTCEQRDRFTRVLKGHINLSMTCFPLGTTGNSLDSIARQHLWRIGADYAHGTGHGVGAALSVHEGPCSINRSLNPTPLEPGMILSNEPGYYKEGEYGIRIENLVVVAEAEHLQSQECGIWCTFKTITLVPIDLGLINLSLLGEEERLWLNSYHEHVKSVLLPLVLPETRNWLEEATKLL